MNVFTVTAITPPQGAEILIILVILGLLASVTAGVAWLALRLARRAGPVQPSGQQPPPGYWWDGQKWNPPAQEPPA